MICLTPKTSQTLSEIIGISLWRPSSLDLNPLDYTMWGILENKTNVPSYQNIGSLETTIAGEWDKMPEECIWKHLNRFVLIQ